MERFKKLETLGDGSFGWVFKAEDVQTGEIVAVKKFKQKYTQWEDCMKDPEVKTLIQLVHPNIVKLKEVIRQNDFMFMIFEFMEKDMGKWMGERIRNPFTENEIKDIMLQLLKGVNYIHRSKYFHRDLKPENILVDGNIVKISDFGLIRKISRLSPKTEYVSTRWYRAPEWVLRSKNYSYEVDIFALGWIFAELYTLRPIFPGQSELDQMFKIWDILGTPTEEEWPEGYQLAENRSFIFPKWDKIDLSTVLHNAPKEAIELIEWMLKYNPKERPSASQLIIHPFFSSKLKEISLPQTDPDTFDSLRLGKDGLSIQK